MRDGRPHSVHNHQAKEYPRVGSVETVRAGRHKLHFEFQGTGAPDVHAGRLRPDDLRFALRTS